MGLMLTRPDSHMTRGVLDAGCVRRDNLTPARIAAGLLARARLIAATTFAAATVAALAWYALLEPTFQSEAYVAMTPDNPGRQKAMFYSPVILDPVIAAVSGTTATRDRARAALRRKLTIEPAQGEDRRSPTVFVLRVRDTDPRRAQATAAALLDRFIESSGPGAMERERLEREIARAQAQRDDIARLIARLESEAQTLVSANSDTGELATPLAGLAERRAVLDEQIESLQRQLEGLTADAILSAPTLPDKVSRPVPLLVAAAAGLVIGLLASATFVMARLVLPPLRAQLSSAQTAGTRSI